MVEETNAQPVVNEPKPGNEGGAAAPKAAPEKSSEPKAPSKKELKEMKKRKKAAKRAAQKAAIGITPEQQQQLAQQKMDKKKQQTATTTNIKKQLDQTVIRNSGKQKIPALFSHLETREQRNASSPAISHIVHPAILALTLKYSTYRIVGLTLRLRRMMEVFKTVITDYQTPENTTLTRHLTGHLSHQIEYLKTARPLSISMGNAIRWLKQEISHISIDTTEDQAKVQLCDRIDEFIRDKIDFSDKLIVQNAAKHITNGSTILTFGHSHVLEELFKYCAIEENKNFKLVVVDSRPLFEGKKLVSRLIECHAKEDQSLPITKTHIKIQYVLINSLSSMVLEDVDCVFLGAHAMLSNGRLYSRVGLGLIAMMSHSRNIPVLTCCESIKFSDKVQLDSVTTNELADRQDLMHGDAKKPPLKKSFALEQFITQQDAIAAEEKEKKKGKGNQKNDKKENDSDLTDADPLSNWEKMEHLDILNIMYDLTPPEYIKKVVTELGALPPSSVPVILREYKNT